MENKLRAVNTEDDLKDVLPPVGGGDVDGGELAEREIIPATDQRQQEEDMMDAAHEVGKQAAEEREKEFIKAPVFVGVNDAALLQEIISVVEGPVWGPTHQMAIMSKEVFQASSQNWHMSRLGKAQQEQQAQLQKDEIKHKEALDLANELNDFFDLAKTGFKPHQLKEYFVKSRGLVKGPLRGSKDKKPIPTFSNRDLRNVIDFLCVHRFMFPTLADKNYEDNIYVVTIQPSDRLRYLAQLGADYDKIMETYMGKRKIIDDEIQSISDEIQAQADKELPDEEVSNVKNGDTDGIGDSEPGTVSESEL